MFGLEFLKRIIGETLKAECWRSIIEKFYPRLSGSQYLMKYVAGSFKHKDAPKSKRGKISNCVGDRPIA